MGPGYARGARLGLVPGFAGAGAETLAQRVSAGGRDTRPNSAVLGGGGTALTGPRSGGEGGGAKANNGEAGRPKAMR